MGASMKAKPRTYYGYILSQGDYTGTCDDVMGAWYIDSPETDYWDRRGLGHGSLADAKREIRRRMTCECGAGPFRTMRAKSAHAADYPSHGPVSYSLWHRWNAR